MDCIDDAIAQLLRGDRRARDRAAFVLRGCDFDVTRLAPLLAHPHVSRQVKAIEIMRAARAPAAIPLLVPMLGSPESLVARKAASALQQIGPAAADVIAASLPGSIVSGRGARRYLHAGWGARATVPGRRRAERLPADGLINSPVRRARRRGRR
jgi:HEAT repeat protein